MIIGQLQSNRNHSGSASEINLQGQRMGSVGRLRSPLHVSICKAYFICMNTALSQSGRITGAIIYSKILLLLTELHFQSTFPALAGFFLRKKVIQKINVPTLTSRDLKIGSNMSNMISDCIHDNSRLKSCFGRPCIRKKVDKLITERSTYLIVAT